MTAKRPLVLALLSCALPVASVLAQASSQASTRSVLVTPLLHAGALSDSLAHLLRIELANTYHLTSPLNRDATSALQRSDPAGKSWTFESVRDLASSLKADGLVDVAAERVADGVLVTVAWGRAPFDIIDNTRSVAHTSLEEVAQSLAQRITRRGWPASER